MPTNRSRPRLRCWLGRACGVPWSQMGVVRFALALAVGAVLVGTAPACSSVAPAPRSEQEVDREPTPVPDPPPRYTRAETDSGIAPDDDDEGEPTLLIKCEGHEPYVCSLDDGTFRCSDRPCVPACDRVGCVGGDVCRACEDGFRCLAPGASC